MLSIFAIPKPFTSKTALIQENAIKSWLSLHKKIQIILLGKEKGIDEIAKKYKLTHIAKITKNKFGTPLLDDCFSKARQKARYNLLAYVNCDIILLPDFINAVNKIKFAGFLLTGRRYNLDVDYKLIFKKNWEEELKIRLKKESALYKFGALDYFVFPKIVDFKMLPFAAGRTAWDNWIVYKARVLGIPVIDGSLSITAIHQTHDYSHAGGYENVWNGNERKYNWDLIGDRRNFFNVKDSTHIINNNQISKIPFSLQRVIRMIKKMPVLNPLIRLK